MHVNVPKQGYRIASECHSLLDRSLNDQTALEFLILMKVDAYYQSRSPAELWLLFGKKRFARFRFARFGLQPSAVYQSPQTGLGGPPEDIGKLLASSFSEGELRAHATDSGTSFCFSVRDHSALLRLVAGLSTFFSDRCRFSLFAFSALSLFIFFALRLLCSASLHTSHHNARLIHGCLTLLITSSLGNVVGSTVGSSSGVRQA